MDVYQNHPLTVSPGRKFLPTAFLVFISVLVGFVLSNRIDPYLPSPFGNTQKGYQSGFSAAQDSLARNTGNVPTPSDVRTVIGTVTAISGTKFTLSVTQPASGTDQSLSTRTVSIDASTTVMRVALKDPATYRAEVSAYAAKQQGQTGSVGMPPANFTIVGARFSDIKVGDPVSVLSIANIKSLKYFTARYIEIMPKI